MASPGVGATLRQERIRKQFPLEEIARQTKISERLLKAIESDNFEALPGTVFARNFVRQYAAALNLDPRPLLEELPRVSLETAPMPTAPAGLSRSNHWDPRWNSALASIVWTVLAGGAAVAAYIHFNHPANLTSASVQPRPQAVSHLPAMTAAVSAAPGVAPVTVESAPPASAEPFKDAAPPASQPIQVIITALQTSWLQVTADGKTVLTTTLQPKDSRTISAAELVRVLTGNAGGLEISLNGKLLEPLGPQGQVRTVRLTAEGPQLAPKNPTPSFSNPL